MDKPFEVPNLPKENAGEPPKYIRTFSGDMETLKEGGTPDLAPLPGGHARPLDRIVAASPIPEEPAAAPGEVVLPNVPEPEPVYTPAPKEEAPIETYAADFVDRVHETKASTATLLAAEQDQAPAPADRAPAPEEAKEARTNKVMIGAGIALVLVGGAGAYIAYSMYAASHAPVIAQPTVQAPIFVDEQQNLSGSGAALAAQIATSAGQPIRSGSIRLLLASSTTSVFQLVAGTAPGILTRNVNPLGSMAGIVSVGGVQSPFFILSVSSYADTFAGMLSWETVMTRDLAAIYPAYPAAPAQAAATTTPSSGTTTPAAGPVMTAPAQAGFKDEMASNHDVRVYRDSAGRSIVTYGYWNQSTLVIARDPAAFGELMSRLANSRSR